MKIFNLRSLAALVLFFPAICHAGVSAIVVIYQPIITAGEAEVIETPKGFAVMPVPFECLLTDAPRSRLSEDSNLVSRAGVTIGSSIDDDIVYVHFENLQPPAGFKLNAEDIAEVTLECIRRMAEGAPKRPILKITGKQGDEAKWRQWQEHFQKLDFKQPYIRPNP